jgi:hypothetical protein
VELGRELDPLLLGGVHGLVEQVPALRLGPLDPADQPAMAATDEAPTTMFRTARAPSGSR